MFENIYQGIIFPDRAENLADSLYSDYRVFLEHWDILSNELRNLYEGMSLRGETHSLVVYGEQGSGKTLFARRLKNDFELCKNNNGSKIDDKENLWARITGGSYASESLINKAIINTDIQHYENDKKWVETLKDWKKQNKNRYSLVILDNAERTYFIQGLLNMNDVEYLQVGKSEGAIELAAERFVELSRGDFRNSVFIMLTNDNDFAKLFKDKVDKQHKNLINVTSLPFPTNKDKETVVRVNINRLNPISYWYCIDKAGPEAKRNVYDAICGEKTYPDSFKAVDEALKTAAKPRIGRPGSKCTLTLFVMADCYSFKNFGLSIFGKVYQDVWEQDWISIITFLDEWGDNIVGNDKRKAMLLSSEWNLRIILVGEPFVNCLIDGDKNLGYVKKLINKLSIIHTPGTHIDTKDEYWNELSKLVSECPVNLKVSNEDFWKKGQVRNNDYERPLKELFSSYNTCSTGFLNYRPDYVIEPYSPCSILNAKDNEIDSINNAIKRSANVIEFTAIKDLDINKITSYLQKKITNYIDILEKQ